MPSGPPSVRLRRATSADAQRIWIWRNEASVRAASFNTAEIPLEAHTQWFAKRVNDPQTCFYIGMDDGGEDVGYVRFDLIQAVAEANIIVSPAARGRGFGSALIRSAVSALITESTVNSIRASVKASNVASLRAFRSAGFVVRDGAMSDSAVVELVYSAEALGSR